MEQTVINGYFGVDNQMPNTKALGNPDRGMYTSVSLIRPFRVEGSSQQRISSFATGVTTTGSGFWGKLQDTDTARATHPGNWL